MEQSLTKRMWGFPQVDTSIFLLGMQKLHLFILFLQQMSAMCFFRVSKILWCTMNVINFFFSLDRKNINFTLKPRVLSVNSVLLIPNKLIICDVQKKGYNASSNHTSLLQSMWIMSFIEN